MRGCIQWLLYTSQATPELGHTAVPHSQPCSWEAFSSNIPCKEQLTCPLSKGGLMKTMLVSAGKSQPMAQPPKDQSLTMQMLFLISVPERQEALISYRMCF